jgi:hypothetical protein
VEYSLEDCTRQQHNFLGTVYSFHVKGNNKYTRSVQCIVFMITGILSIREMTTDEYGLRSMDIDPANLRMSSKMWEKRGLVPIGKMIEHTLLYGTDLSDDENAESMMKRFINLPAEVITQGVSRIHEEFSKFFCAERFEGTLELEKIVHSPHNISSLYRIDVLTAKQEFSRLVIETASQRPATLKIFEPRSLQSKCKLRYWN